MTLRRVLGLAALLAGLAVALPANATPTPKEYRAPYDRGELVFGSGVGPQIPFGSSGTEPDQAPAEPARNGLLTIGGGITGFNKATAEVVFTPETTRTYVISADLEGSVANAPNVNLCLTAFLNQSTVFGGTCTIVLPSGPKHMSFPATLPANTALSIEVSLRSTGGMVGGPVWVRVNQFTIA